MSPKAEKSTDNSLPMAFVAMSFNPELEPVYLRIIKPALESRGFECVRGDEICEFGIIVEQLVEHITRAALVLCDLTYGNPNVYYELGLAHALDKPTILISQGGAEFPFDVRHQRAIVYKDERFSLLELRDTLDKYLDKVSEGGVQSQTQIEIPITPSELESARAALYHHSLDAQRYAVHFLGDYRDRSAYDRINSLTNSGNSAELIRDAFEALYKIYPERALDDMLSSRGLWNHEHFIVRERVVSLLGNYKPTSMLFGYVIDALGDWSWGVRATVCQVLGKWGQERSLEILKDKLVDPDLAVRAAAQEAITKILRKRTAARKPGAAV